MQQVVLEYMVPLVLYKQWMTWQYYTLETFTSMSHRLNAFNIFTVSDELCVSSSCVSSNSLSRFLAEHVTCQYRLPIPMVPSLMGDSWLYALLRMVQDIPCQCPMGTKVSAIADIGSLPQSQRQWRGGTGVYKSLPSVLERISRLVGLRWCTKQCYYYCP